MSQHDILFSITEDSRDGINFQVRGGENDRIIKKKEEILQVIDRLRTALINETYPFNPIVNDAIAPKEILKGVHETVKALLDTAEQRMIFSIQRETIKGAQLMVVNGVDIYYISPIGDKIKVDMTIEEMKGLFHSHVSAKRIAMLIANNAQIKAQMKAMLR
jgi:hypothetical protein